MERPIEDYLRSIEAALLEVQGAASLGDWEGAGALLDGVIEDAESAQKIVDGKIEKQD